jgi:hypothetical protein
VRAIVEALVSLSASAFYGLMLGSLVIGVVALVAGIVAVAGKKRSLGLALIGVCVLGSLTFALFLTALVVDIACTGRSGAWICDSSADGPRPAVSRAVGSDPTGGPTSTSPSSRRRRRRG